MAFRFKLETLLTYRRNLEEQARYALAKQQLILDNQQSRLAGLEAARLQAIQEFEQRKKGKLPVLLFSFYMESLREKDLEIQAQKSVIESQLKLVAQARAQLAETMKKRKIIERAREKAFQQHLQESIRQEANENDEQIMLRFGRWS